MSIAGTGAGVDGERTDQHRDQDQRNPARTDACDQRDTPDGLQAGDQIGRPAGKADGFIDFLVECRGQWQPGATHA